MSQAAPGHPGVAHPSVSVMIGERITMRQFLGVFFTLATLIVVGIGVATQSGAAPLKAQAATPAAVDKAVLGQGVSALDPNRVLLLQRRTFAPGSDSGAHPAPGPTVLYVDSGTIEFGVDTGTALLTRKGETETTGIEAGERVALEAGDAVFYDEGVVHDVANPNTDAGVTLEARFNPNETAPATPQP
jgi:quercetin dioxygenase-like cupin family protein